MTGFLVFAIRIILRTKYNWILSRDSGKRNLGCRKWIALCVGFLFKDMEQANEGSRDLPYQQSTSTHGFPKPTLVQQKF